MNPLPQSIIKRVTKATLRPTYNFQMVLRKPRYILVVGHMRSGSSLLTHILNSNPEILGYGETHLNYRSASDLDELPHDVLPSMRRIKIPRYVLDKVLHSRHLMHSGILASPTVLPIFLVREPAASIKSMLRQFPDWFTGAPLSPLELQSKAVDHYIDRVELISRHLHELQELHVQFEIVTHSQLTQDTDATLSRLSEFLKLHAPLTRAYSKTRFTGQHSKGDTSEHIQFGAIKQSIHHEVNPPLDAELLQDPLKLYKTLLTQCNLREEVS